MRATAKAVVKLFARTNRKTGGFFIVKRAQAHEIGPALFQLHIASDHIDDIDPAQQILYEGMRNHAFTRLNLRQCLLDQR